MCALGHALDEIAQTLERSEGSVNRQALREGCIIDRHISPHGTLPAREDDNAWE